MNILPHQVQPLCESFQMSTATKVYSNSDITLPSRPARPCPRCPHRLSDLSSHEETTELAEPGNIEITSTPKDTSSQSSEDDQPAEMSTLSTKWTNICTLIEVPASILQLARENADIMRNIEVDDGNPPTYDARSEDVLVGMSPEQLEEKARAAEQESKKKPSIGEEAEKIKNSGLQKRVQFSDVRVRYLVFAEEDKVEGELDGCSRDVSETVDRKVKSKTVRFLEMEGEGSSSMGSDEAVGCIAKAADNLQSCPSE